MNHFDDDLVLVFNYQVPKVGNGLQTTIPNFKEKGYILYSVEFSKVEVADGLEMEKTGAGSRPDIEVSIGHSGTNQKFGTSYFQIFDKISLGDYWYRLSDGDKVELSLKNKSNKVMNLNLTYVYKPCRGTLINSTSMRSGDLKESNLLQDISEGSLLTDLYLKSGSQMRSLKLSPKFKCVGDSDSKSAGENEGGNESDSDANDDDSVWKTELDTVCSMEVNSNEIVLDFSGKDFIGLRPMLSYYTLEVDFVDPEQQVFVLAYGFKK